ncbi:putative holliday junction resolvase [Apostasia shenzhenica]|uniref:Putative holliday junction resolvase n=1 Tax=Apostasia shenzhenica TaxID=1088818 RepID=A0A2I0AZQ8_9ASPA|nr:putative holliday junction resolvase [Apostasia shenzhenica]
MEPAPASVAVASSVWRRIKSARSGFVFSDSTLLSLAPPPSYFLTRFYFSSVGRRPRGVSCSSAPIFGLNVCFYILGLIHGFILLCSLHFLCGKNLERATRIVDQGGVKRVSGKPSGRFVFLVSSSFSPCPFYLKSKSLLFFEVAAESRRKEEYVVFLEKFCTCQSFFYDVVNKGEQLYMKLLKPIELFKKLVMEGSTKQARLLGLDVGHKYVGLAVSDSCNKIASPLSVLVRKKSNIDSMAKDFLTLCVEALLQPLNLHPVEQKTVSDKFAAVGILQALLDIESPRATQHNCFGEYAYLPWIYLKE